MQRSQIRFGPIVALAAIAATFLGQVSSAAQSSRFQRLPETTATEMITATGVGGSTWFEGTDTRGQRVTVTFLPRFATVVKDGRRVPVSTLRPGDQVEVVGHTRGDQMAASSARATGSRTAGARIELKKEPAERR